jgi:hypothetical protein
MTYAFTIAELRHFDVKALPDGAEYTGNQFANPAHLDTHRSTLAH